MPPHHDNNKHLIEQTLERAISMMCVRCKLGLPDWDLNDSLRAAIQQPECLTQIQDLIKRYDESYELAKQSNIPLDIKYQSLYKLNK